MLFFKTKNIFLMLLRIYCFEIDTCYFGYLWYSNKKKESIKRVVEYEKENF